MVTFSSLSISYTIIHINSINDGHSREGYALGRVIEWLNRVGSVCSLIKFISNICIIWDYTYTCMHVMLRKAVLHDISVLSWQSDCEIRRSSISRTQTTMAAFCTDLLGLNCDYFQILTSLNDNFSDWNKEDQNVDQYHPILTTSYR